SPGEHDAVEVRATGEEAPVAPEKDAAPSVADELPAESALEADQALGPDEDETEATPDEVSVAGEVEAVALSDAVPPDAEELVEASPPSGPAEALDTGTDTGAGQVIDDAPTPLPEPDESEVPAADATTGKQDSSSAPWIDPKLATFTLATIYKVQGLYKQALQVLDMLEAKGGDPERIEDERRSITRSMTSGSKPE
ncbi:MAG: hypothetical protein IID14_05475, partial [Candidatus Marinimicrobia bacterium]|nr:hypothetical protein [Candidatus Neomarinimicrobiota bacterium]